MNLVVQDRAKKYGSEYITVGVNTPNTIPRHKQFPMLCERSQAKQIAIRLQRFGVE